jgi:hypothetical protein
MASPGGHSASPRQDLNKATDLELLDRQGGVRDCDGLLSLTRPSTQQSRAGPGVARAPGIRAAG